MYQKEENSVLFSLGNLRTLAMAPGTGVTMPHIPGEATKMLDISRLAPALNLDRGPAMGPSTLMGPRSSFTPPRWIIPVCIGLGTLVICIAILSLALMFNKPAVTKPNMASVTTAEKRPPSTPTRSPAVLAKSLKAEPQAQDEQRAAKQPAPSTAEKPLRSVEDLTVHKGLPPTAKPRKHLSKKKRRAHRRWKKWKKRKALLKRRRARRRRAKAAKRRRARRTRLARAKRSRQKLASRSKKRRDSRKASELDDLLTGF